MPSVQRMFSGPAAEWAHMKAVIDAQPSEHLHVVDLPYRLCSWAFDEPAKDVVVWAPRGGGKTKLGAVATDVLGKHVEFVPVCPEVEIGLGTPREPIHLVETAGEIFDTDGRPV